MIGSAEATLLLALTAGMLGAVNPCGFAVLPAYLSLIDSVRRAVLCSLALTLGYVLVFGAFGLFLTPFESALMPRLPWLTLALGLLGALGGAWLLSGRSLPALPIRAPAPKSMVLFGMAYAVASLGCAIGPFLALVVSSVSAASILPFFAYALGMGLVVTATALAVALLRTSLVTRLRRFSSTAPRLGGLVLLASSLYVAYYGWYGSDLHHVGHDPLVNAATSVQQHLAAWVASAGPLGWSAALAALALGATLGRLRTRARSRPDTPAPTLTPTDSA